MNILGIIPARKNSKGIKNKNRLKLNGKTLAELAVINATKSKLINKIVFSSDDDYLLKKIEKIGPFCPFKRPKKFSLDASSSYDVCKHAVNWLENNENWRTDVVVLLSPTTPFRTSKIIDEVLKKFLSSKANSIITITDPTYPPQWFVKSDGKFLSLLDEKNSKYKRRQEVPKTYIPAGMIYAIKKKTLFNLKGILPNKNSKTIGHYVNPNISINIDNYSQYLLAKIFSKNKIF